MTQVLINFQQKLAKLTSLTEYSKDLKAQLANAAQTIEVLDNELAFIVDEVDNKLTALASEIEADEKALETKNSEISKKETLINNIKSSSSIPTVPTVPTKLEESVEEGELFIKQKQEELANVSVEVEKAAHSSGYSQMNAAQHTKDVFALDKTKKNIDETLATAEGKAQIVEGLNSLVNNDNNLLTYEELVKGNIFSKRTENGLMPDVLVSTILSRLNKAIAVDKANALRVCKDFKNHHNPVLTKAQKKLFMTFIRSNKVS